MSRSFFVIAMLTWFLAAHQAFGEGQIGAGSSENRPLVKLSQIEVPDGKAVVLVYTQQTLGNAFAPRVGLLVLGANGPFGVLHNKDFRAEVVDPGVIRLWVVGSRGEGCSISLRADAGNIYFLKASNLPDIGLVSKEVALADLMGRIQATD